MIRLQDIYMRDPFILPYRNGYCLFGTTDENAWGGKAKGFKGYFSKNLVDFEGPFILFENDENFWADENFWEPEVHEYRGR